ncbi:MAG TPA: L,D-transpeptidase family protein [Candidatus Dormibacteraeota bacterium]|jgi:lipoprotein-anchoring transpeptidase ErfK/SrfK|nr:L,D-transpeptidase family protein [Candidatus Dormibacteraeota bacterium]
MSALSGRALSRVALPLLSLVLLAACSPVGASTPAPRPTPSPSPLPSSVVGSISFSPPADATAVDPGVPVVITAATAGATLTSVTVTPDGGSPLAGDLSGSAYTVKAGSLAPDARYTVTAVAEVRQAAGAAPVEDSETSHFSTVTTPRVTALTPATIGDGQSVVLTLSEAASAIDVSGPVKASLGPDGTTVTVVPATYAQGQSYAFTLIARNLKGIAGAPQKQTFATLGAATAYAYPAGGSGNMGVAVPLTLTLSAAPADKSDFASHLTVTADSPAAPAASPSADASPAPAASPAPSPAANPCTGYAPPAPGTALTVNPVWLSATRVRLAPTTPDGYWPANSTITVHAAMANLKTSAGNWWGGDLTSSFSTGDKRVIDVNLSTQTLTACKNGVQANQFLISSGTPSHFTYTGHFAIYRRVADEEMKSPEGPFAPDYYDIKHVPWTQYFDGGAALHGAWWHNNFGHPMSHGCVNVQTPTDNTRWPKATPQAEWLWNFDNVGDPVIVSGVTPGLNPAQQQSD